VWLLRGLAGIAGGLVILILGFLLLETLPALRHIGLSRFFTDATWHPADALYNLIPMLWGTLFATAGAVLVATPLGILAALFARYYAPSFVGNVFRKGIEILAGIPSVVYGLWGLLVLVPVIARWQLPGPSLLAGMVILTAMILPTMMLVADSAFSQVPQPSIQGAVALGVGRWSIIQRIILPASQSALLTGIILQTGRAMGETMAILMVCGNVVQTPTSLFAPIRTLTGNIALEMAYAVGDHRAALFLSGLLLMGMVIVLVVTAEGIHRGHVHVQ